jgi:hypothetical protein
MSEKTMMLVQSTWNEKQTFRMIPITESCPYVECIMDPDTKVFVIISKITKTTLHMLPKLDDNGDPAPLKTKRPNGRMVKEERRTIETFQEFYIEDLTAIEGIISIFAINSDAFDYKKFMPTQA